MFCMTSKYSFILTSIYSILSWHRTSFFLQKIATTSTAVGPDGKELKLPPSTGGQGPSSRVSKSTTLTDDSSADDKSSVSSKPESIESHPAVTPVAPSWGGGNTFADVLKKKQQAAAAAAASTTAEEKNDDKPAEE